MSEEKETIFDKVAKSKATKGGSYIDPGDYLYTVLGVKLNDGHKGVSIALEFLVEEAQAKPGERAPNPVGSTCSAVHNFKHDSAAGNVKAFVLAVLGLQESEVSDAEFSAKLKEVCSTEQPFRGRRVRNSTFQYVPKARRALPASEQNPLTLNDFTHVPQTDAEVAARRAELDSGSKSTPAEAPAASSSALDKFKKK